MLRLAELGDNLGRGRRCAPCGHDVVLVVVGEQVDRDQDAAARAAPAARIAAAATSAVKSGSTCSCSAAASCATSAQVSAIAVGHLGRMAQRLPQCEVAPFAGLRAVPRLERGAGGREHVGVGLGETQEATLQSDRLGRRRRPRRRARRLADDRCGMSPGQCCCGSRRSGMVDRTEGVDRALCGDLGPVETQWRFRFRVGDEPRRGCAEWD